MNKSTKSYLKLFWQLLKADLLVFKQTIIGETINTFVWVFSTLVVATYIFPQLGMTKAYGAFYAVGIIASCSFWTIWESVSIFIADIQGDSTISYPLTLPLPSWLVVVKFASRYSIRAAIFSAMILPLCKLLLLDRLDLSNLSYFKFVAIFLVINFFIGFFSIFVSSIVKDMNHINQVGIRILFPMWFFGGTQFSWETIYSLSPRLAYMIFLNPLLYASEGIHAAVLGQKGYIPFWICIVMLWIFTIISGWLGIAKLKKRLDFV